MPNKQRFNLALIGDDTENEKHFTIFSLRCLLVRSDENLTSARYTKKTINISAPSGETLDQINNSNIISRKKIIYYRNCSLGLQVEASSSIQLF